MTTAAQDFLRSAAEKSANLTHRHILRKGIDTYNGAVNRGLSRFMNWEVARQKCHEIKFEAINHLDRYLLEFEQHVNERGGHVFWAQNAEVAYSLCSGLRGWDGLDGLGGCYRRRTAGTTRWRADGAEENVGAA